MSFPVAGDMVYGSLCLASDGKKVTLLVDGVPRDFDEEWCDCFIHGKPMKVKL